jgi:hypothetical protein
MTSLEAMRRACEFSATSGDVVDDGCGIGVDRRRRDTGFLKFLVGGDLSQIDDVANADVAAINGDL